MSKNLSYYVKKNLITVSIGFILFLALINTIASFLQLQAAKDDKALHMEISEARRRINLVNTHVNLADMAFRGFMVIEDNVFLNPYNDKVLPVYKNNYDSLGILLKKHGFNTGEIPQVEEKVSTYFELINSMIFMRRNNQLDEIIEIIKSDPGYEVWKVYNAFMNKALAHETELSEKSFRRSERISTIVSVVQFLIFILGIPALIINIRRLKKDTNLKKQLFDDIQESNKRYIFDPKVDEKQDSQNEKVIIENLIQNLKKISMFIKGVTGGNFSIDWDGLNKDNKDANKENIVGDLINMREQMRTVREQDELRLWATEGITKFGEIVRGNQNNTNQLCYEVISNLVKYLKAIQGGVFILNDNDPEDHYLELVACYAFSRKKYLKKRIDTDQGLVGQAYLEEDIIYMTDIPQDYVSIKSGLGEGNPSTLLIIPLKHNNKVEAIIEMASFNHFNPHEIELAQKIGEYVASAIASAKATEKTKQLLENTQEQAEHMRTQEEEMRQNMEELQATQEEVQRRTLEYQQVIESNNLEIEDLKEKLRQFENQEN